MTTPEIGLREQILVIAKILFIQQGYHGLAMRQISDAVGVSKDTQFLHWLIDREYAQCRLAA